MPVLRRARAPMPLKAALTGGAQLLTVARLLSAPEYAHIRRRAVDVEEAERRQRSRPQGPVCADCRSIGSTGISRCGRPLALPLVLVLSQRLLLPLLIEPEDNDRHYACA